MTIDMIFGRIRKGHHDLIDHVKRGVPWSSISEETRYHLVHNQIAHPGGLHAPVAAALAASEVQVMTAMIGRMAA